MDDVITLAADVILDYYRGSHPSQRSTDEIAKRLADAGLLVTPEELAMREILAENPRPNVDVDALFERVDLERAVLDAADKWRDIGGTGYPLIAAVDALRAATPKDDAS